MAKTLIKTITVPVDESAAVCEIDFIDGTADVVMDNTYDVYEWVFTNLNPQTDQAEFTFQVNAAGGSGFNETMTTTVVTAYHAEDGAYATINYNPSNDQGQGTAYQPLALNPANDADSGVSGILTFYAPSSGTYVKHFIARMGYMHEHSDAWDMYTAGYINTTTAVDEISFKFSSGNIDSGVIKMYGLAKS